MQSSPPPPPTSSSAAKMLYEEAIWTPTNPYRHRSSHRRARICVAITFGILMFGLGVSVGAFLHAMLFPDGSSPIIKFPSFLTSSGSFEESPVNSTVLSHLGSSVELEDSEVIEEEDGMKKDSEEEEEDKGKEKESEEVSEEKNKTKRRGKKEESKEKEEKEKEEKEEEEEEDEAGSGEKFVKANRECTNITWYSSRLPRTAEPIEYDLTLHPNLTNGEVEAEVSIRILIKNETKLLILNAENLEMNSFEITRKGSKLKADFVKCEVMTQWAWKFGKRLHKGDHIVLKIKYSSQMKSDLQGLYFSTHLGTDGKKTKSAATQFEPTFARKMLPCFDEPNFKATFQVSIIRNANHIARSNMNLSFSKEYKNGLIKDEFEKSVKMSTYLLAVAVLDGYGYIKRLTRNTTKPIEVRLYAPEDMLEGQSEFGLDTTIRALEFFENYFNISYPLDKIDLLALDDFSEGAMENWGLVTFRDSALLFNERKASVVAKEHIALIICHEIAHQWFGNLVTMDWWNEVFLNEGFANYMEYKCVDELFPDWSIMSRFYAENLAFSQEPDGFLSSRAIESDDDDSLLNLFDAINYHKAAAIIHMIAEMAGQRNFQTALIEYLNKYAYSNAIGVDLWKIVEKHANLQGRVSIPDLAKAYTTQVGYPLVTVERTEEGILVHNQTRFLFAEGEKAEEKRGDWKWPIPISYRASEDNKKKLHWIQADDRNVTWETPSNGWLILNTGGVGYFKVLYDGDTYRKLVDELTINHTKISPIDRSMILVDSYDLSKTSLLNISVYFDLLEYVESKLSLGYWGIGCVAT
uniref:Aminopeptidase n=1 Tax=Caenorhabditis tropicalis TaxID=1561998 RepID=A0A1I7UT26_9PELO